MEVAIKVRLAILADNVAEIKISLKVKNTKMPHNYAFITAVYFTKKLDCFKNIHQRTQRSASHHLDLQLRGSWRS